MHAMQCAANSRPQSDPSHPQRNFRAIIALRADHFPRLTGKPTSLPRILNPIFKTIQGFYQLWLGPLRC